MASLVKIVQDEEQNVNVVSLETAFMIIYKIYNYYEIIDYLHPNLFFDDFAKLQVYLETFENDEPRLTVTLAIVENMLEYNPSLS